MTNKKQTQKILIPKNYQNYSFSNRPQQKPQQTQSYPITVSYNSNNNKSFISKIVKTFTSIYTLLKIFIVTAVLLTLISCGLKADENSPYLESIIGHFVKRTLKELDKNLFYIFREPLFIAIITISVILLVLYLVAFNYLKKKEQSMDILPRKRKRKITDEDILEVPPQNNDSKGAPVGCQSY